MAAERSRAELLEDRRRLVESLLQSHLSRGGRLELPIGASAAESWLLDAVDVPALLSALSRTPPGRLDLLTLCSSVTRAARGPPGDDNPFRSNSAAHLGLFASASSALCDAECEPPPLLQLPQLAIGLTEPEVQDLAYLMYAANCCSSSNTKNNSSGDGCCEDELALLESVRGQLNVDAARGTEVSRLLVVVRDALSSHAREDAGGMSTWSAGWTATLELPLCLLGTVLPRDFGRFRGFVTWRDTLAHTITAALAASVRDGWKPHGPAACPSTGSSMQNAAAVNDDNADAMLSPTAQQLMARLKAALRRCDVRDADDYDEAEYKAATRSVGEHASALAQCTAAGWTLPWGLRVALVQALLHCVFDPLDESSYVDCADDYLQVLQYAATRAMPLLVRCRALLKRLAALSAAQQQRGQHSTQQQQRQGTLLAAGLDSNDGPPCLSHQAAQLDPSQFECDSHKQDDARLVAAVGAAVASWVNERLCDYHARVDGVGGAEALPVLVDLMAFGAASSGAPPQQVTAALAAAVRSSVTREVKRRVAAENDSNDGTGDANTAATAAAKDFKQESHITALCAAARQLAREEQDTWASAFAAQLPAAPALALAALHDTVGAALLPWLSSGVALLDAPTCQALRAAMQLEPLLLGPITAAAGMNNAPTALGRVVAWDVPTALQPVLAAWVGKQISGFNIWVDRQLHTETWKPLSEGQPHSASARELRAIALESLDALFGLGLPLPAAILSMLLEGVDSMMHRYLHGVLNRLGPPAALVPMPPPLTRYKREVAVKQEEAERGMPGLPDALPPPGCVGRRGEPFLQSVTRVEAEACRARIEPLLPSVVVVMAASLEYLLDTLQPMSDAVAQRWQEEVDRHSGTGSCDDSGGGAANPFIDTPPGVTNTPSSTSVPSHRRRGSGGALASLGGWGSPPPIIPQQQQQQDDVQQQQSRAAEVFGTMLEAAAQSLQHGVDAVLQWLAVRVVWWQQRAGWCELLYRHRVTNARADMLLAGLADVLGGEAAALPRTPRLRAAGALLRETAAALERALLDGGPCRWYVPSDTAHIEDDVDALRRLFFADGDGLSMQEVNAALAGVTALLQVMQLPTSALLAAHCNALGVARPSPLAVSSGVGAEQQQQQHQQPPYGAVGGGGSIQAGVYVPGMAAGGAGPLSAGATAARARAAAATAGASLPAGSSNSPRAGTGVKPTATAAAAAAGGGGGGGGGSNSPLAAASASRSGWPVSIAAMVAAGSDPGMDERVLLRILCHRADHAASKHLKEVSRVPKVRDETLGEALGRLTRLKRT